MPERYLLQILRDLTRRGIIRSCRGGGGGFRLNRDPWEISLLDLVEAIEGPLGSSLPAKGHLPRPSVIPLQKTLAEITEMTRRALAATTLANLTDEWSPERFPLVDRLETPLGESRWNI